jgi:hypothetical protein
MSEVFLSLKDMDLNTLLTTHLSVRLSSNMMRSISSSTFALVADRDAGILSVDSITSPSDSTGSYKMTLHWRPELFKYFKPLVGSSGHGAVQLTDELQIRAIG